MTYGPNTITRHDGTVLVIIPVDNFRFRVAMVGNPTYNVAQRLMEAECKEKVKK